ncbi:MAG: hypothetical protein JSS09_09425, partial [Verrucomicrobia bacterium]|nr:hypothetical protein [Verrucomicrobiota bacterium]
MTKKTIEKLSQEKQLRVIGTGGGMMGDIYKMSLSFQFFHQVNLEEARSLLVDVVDMYLKDINETKSIRPYLHNYPFTPKDIEIDIWIKNSDYSNVSHNQIDYIIATKGELHYHLPLEAGTYKRRLFHKETYEEGVQILQKEKDNSSVKDVVCVSIDRPMEKSEDPPSSEVFSPKNRKVCLQGKIVNGRYYSPKKVFSCRAEDYGLGEYISQDRLEDQFACVGFYHPVGDFKRAEMMLLPVLEKKKLEGKDIKHLFYGFGMDVLKTVDSAQDLEILEEEMLEDNMLFVAVS